MTPRFSKRFSNAYRRLTSPSCDSKVTYATLLAERMQMINGLVMRAPHLLVACTRSTSRLARCVLPNSTEIARIPTGLVGYLVYWAVASSTASGPACTPGHAFRCYNSPATMGVRSGHKPLTRGRGLLLCFHYTASLICPQAGLSCSKRRCCSKMCTAESSSCQHSSARNTSRWEECGRDVHAFWFRQG
jgi:hypothetical protein